MEDDYSSVVGVSFVMWLTMLVFVLVSGLIGALRLPRLLPPLASRPRKDRGAPCCWGWAAVAARLHSALHSACAGPVPQASACPFVCLRPNLTRPGLTCSGIKLPATAPRRLARPHLPVDGGWDPDPGRHQARADQAPRVPRRQVGRAARALRPVRSMRSACALLGMLACNWLLCKSRCLAAPAPLASPRLHASCVRAHSPPLSVPSCHARVNQLASNIFWFQKPSLLLLPIK